jgi:phospholipase C
MPEGLDNLKHIVCLMMENRSFDHMIGFLQSDNYPINGLSGKETNLDQNGVPVQVSNDAAYSGDLAIDPGHSHFDVRSQMFDGADPSTTPIPAMSGFVKNYSSRHTGDIPKSHNLMKCFSAASLSVLSTLAKQFCVCNNWFSSVPGPTFPNRAFAHAATSIGRVDMTPTSYIGISKTIYELLHENGVSSRIYFHDTSLAFTFPALLFRFNDYFSPFADFVSACSNDSLPAYSFIEPRYNTLQIEDKFGPASDQHPDHDVHQGELLIQQVFQAIWNNEAIRNSTLLVIIYDEHGGLFDHVAPPQRVPNPDGKVWAGAAGDDDPPFDFTWLGVRVPAILISPYIQPGGINPTVFDHTSAIATVSKVFLQDAPVSSLTERDKNANTFEGVFNTQIARTGNIAFPAAAPRAMARAAAPEQLVTKPLTGHQQALVDMATYLNSQLPPEMQSNTDPRTVTTEGAAAAYLAEVVAGLQAAAPVASA